MIQYPRILSYIESEGPAPPAEPGLVGRRSRGGGPAGDRLGAGRGRERPGEPRVALKAAHLA